MTIAHNQGAMGEQWDMRGAKCTKGVFPPVEKRFWSRVDRRGPDECWPWTRGTDSRGYGLIKVNGKNTRASRVSWSLAHGVPFPEHLDACHTCDNPICVNPAHIWPGTAKENAADATKKGRLRGGTSWNASITHCKRGHDLATPDNEKRIGLGKTRRCVICIRAYHSKKENAKRPVLKAEVLALKKEVEVLRAGLEGIAKDHGGAYDPMPSFAVQDLMDAAKRVLKAADAVTGGSK